MNCAVILAAGSGTRMQNPIPKPLITIAGRKVIHHVISAFENAPSFDRLIIVVPKDMIETYTEVISEFNTQKSIDLIEGKETRMKSAYAGLLAVGEGCEFVAIHDAARVLVNSDIIENTLKKAKEKGGAIAAGQIYDTVKQVAEETIIRTIDRGSLMAAYTPQVFRYNLITDAYEKALRDGFEATDSASVMEYVDFQTDVYDIGARDIKLTVEQDVIMAEAIMSGGSVHCGTGYDTHRLVHGRKLILGGMVIPFEKGLLGHSDADVLIHSIMDALLGGAGLRDIGYHYPDTDERYKDVSSIELLKDTERKLTDSKFKITNIDCTVICQNPKLSPYNEMMTNNIAMALNINPNQVNIKATTTEEIGDHGQGLAISAMAVCSLIKFK